MQAHLQYTRSNRLVALAALLLPVTLTSSAQAEGGDNLARFAIHRFQIEGARSLAQTDLEKLVAPLTGSDREYQDIQRALEAIEVAYRKQGFAAVQVKAPEQEITNGVVRLDVIETVIDKVYTPGERKWFDLSNIRTALPALKEGITPNSFELSAQLALANENPARQLEIVLGIGAEDGKVDALVKTNESDPLRFTASLDDTGSAQTGKHRLGFAVQHANLWNSDHVAALAYQTSPEKPSKVGIYSLSYRLPIYAWAGALDFVAVKSTVDAGTTPTTAGDFAFAGSGTVLGLLYTHTLPRQGDANQKIQVGWNIKAYDNSCTVGTFGSAACGPAAADVTARPLTLGYIRSVASPGRNTDITASFVVNLPGGKNGHDSDFQLAHPSPNDGSGARAKYQLIRASMNHLQTLPGDWQFRLATQAQWSPQTLISQEQIGLAGNSAVRGFNEREVARDTGVLINAEAYTPNISPSLSLPGTLRALAFLDAATGHNQLLAGETQPKNSLASWGLGLRHNRDKDVSVRLEVAQVLTPNGNQSRGDWRTHFNLNLSF
jgi:hemolysin activation/secretion protein